MEIVTAETAPVLGPAATQAALLEMAAVVRTLFGVGLQGLPRTAPAEPARVPSQVSGPEPVASLPVPTPRAIAVPSIAVPPAPAPAIPAVSIPAPSLPVPSLAVPRLRDAPPPRAPDIALTPEWSDAPERPETRDAPDAAERHSLALLQEIAYLDD